MRRQDKYTKLVALGSDTELSAERKSTSEDAKHSLHLVREQQVVKHLLPVH